MKRWMLPVTAIASVGLHEVASACSFHNPLEQAPVLGATVLVGSEPVLLGTAESRLVDDAGADVAIEVAVSEVSYGNGTRVLWRTSAPLAAGLYTWHSAADSEHVLDVDPSRDTHVTLTAGAASMVFNPTWMEVCGAFGSTDSLDLVLSGLGIGTTIVELSNEAGDMRVTVAAPTGDLWDNSDRDVGGPDPSRRIAHIFLWQAPLQWGDEDVCVKVRALNNFSSLTEPIDIGCYSTSKTTPIPESFSTEIVEPTSPQQDDEGCSGGPVGSLAALGLLALRRRS